MLPDSGAGAQRCGHRGFATHSAHGGPSGGARAARGARGVSELDARIRPPGGDRAVHACWHHRSRLCRARAAHAAAHAGPRRGLPCLAVRDRRSALRIPVGTRLQARVSPAGRARGPVSGHSACRAHGHGRSAHARRDRRTPAPGTRRDLSPQLRPAQYPVSRCRARQCAPAAARFHRARARRRCGHRLLPVATQDRGNSRMAERARQDRACVSRRLARGAAPDPPGAFSARRGGDRVRDGRLRHGHRQARCPLRRPCRSAGKHGSLLPGDRPRRP